MHKPLRPLHHASCGENRSPDAKLGIIAKVQNTGTRACQASPCCGGHDILSARQTTNTVWLGAIATSGTAAPLLSRSSAFSAFSIFRHELYRVPVAEGKCIAVAIPGCGCTIAAAARRCGSAQSASCAILRAARRVAQAHQSSWIVRRCRPCCAPMHPPGQKRTDASIYQHGISPSAGRQPNY